MRFCQKDELKDGIAATLNAPKDNQAFCKECLTRKMIDGHQVGETRSSYPGGCNSSARTSPLSVKQLDCLSSPVPRRVTRTWSSCVRPSRRTQAISIINETSQPMDQLFKDHRHRCNLAPPSSTPQPQQRPKRVDHHVPLRACDCISAIGISV